jgi:hypothetical protein
MYNREERFRRVGFWPWKVWRIVRHDGVSWAEAGRRFHRWVWFG